MRKYIWLCLVWLPLASIHAMQSNGLAQLLTLEQAKNAQVIFRGQDSIKHFCPPCGDTLPRPEALKRVVVKRDSIRSPEYMVELNGTIVDLAWVFVRRGGTWRNAARAIGISLPGVARTLDQAFAEAEEMRVQGPLFEEFSWSGVWKYRDSLASSAPVLYTLRVFDADSGLKALLSVDGLDITYRMACSGKREGSSVDFTLTEYLNQNYGRPFPIGVSLFSLERLPSGRFATRWNAMLPAPEAEPAVHTFHRLSLDPYQILD